MISVPIKLPDWEKQHPQLRDLPRFRRDLFQAVADEAVAQFKAHYLKSDEENVNELAPERRKHFWIGVANSVRAEVKGSKVAILVVHPVIAHKVHGGMIIARRVRNLSIPIAEESYGYTPREFEREKGLKLFALKSDNHLLLATRKHKQLAMEFLLKPAVFQDPSPWALPDMSPTSKFTQAVIHRGESILKELYDFSHR